MPNPNTREQQAAVPQGVWLSSLILPGMVQTSPDFPFPRECSAPPPHIHPNKDSSPRMDLGIILLQISHFPTIQHQQQLSQGPLFLFPPLPSSPCPASVCSLHPLPRISSLHGIPRLVPKALRPIPELGWRSGHNLGKNK